MGSANCCHRKESEIQHNQELFDETASKSTHKNKPSVSRARANPEINGERRESQYVYAGVYTSEEDPNGFHNTTDNNDKTLQTERFKIDDLIEKWKDQKIEEKLLKLPNYSRQIANESFQFSQYFNSFIGVDNLYDQGSLCTDGTSIYVGERNKNNLKNGYGKTYYSDGSKKAGIWIEDKFVHGRSVTHFEDDVLIQEGDFIMNKLEGKGVEVFKDYIYKGNFYRSSKEGYGQYQSSKEHYIGEYKNGHRKGQGLLRYLESNNNYEGNFDEDKPNGFGTFKWAHGDEYTGNFVNGLLHGVGKYTWKNGDSFEGSFLNGLKEGYGVLHFKKNNQSLQIHFINNLPHGKGKLVKNDKIKEVEYNHGELLKKDTDTSKK